MNENVVQQRFFIPTDYILQDDPKEIVDFANALHAIPEISEEAYFGKIPDVNRIIKCFERVNKALKMRLYNTIDDATRDTIRTEVENIEELSIRHFNVESVTINVIVHSVEVSSIPVSAGKIDLSSYAQYDDKQAMIEYSRIEITNSGVRYAHREGHHIIVNLPVMVLAAKEVKPEHLAALYFHEIGHSFVQYKTGWNIGTQRMLFHVDEAVRAAFMLYSLVSNAFIVAKNAPNAVKDISMMKTQYDKNREVDKAVLKGTPYEKTGMIGPIWEVWMHYFHQSRIGQRLISSTGATIRSVGVMVGCILSLVSSVRELWAYLFHNSKDSAEAIKADRDKLLSGSFVLGKYEDLMLAFHVVTRQIAYIFKVALNIILVGLPGYAISTAFRSLIPPGVWINRKYEYASDEIASAYGLGPEVAEAFNIIKKISLHEDITTKGIFKYTNRIPVINVITQLPMLLFASIETHASGYPSDRARISNLQKQLTSELESQSLNPKLKKALQEDLKRVSVVYDDYTDPKLNSEDNKHARGFVYFIIRFIKNLVMSGATRTPKAPAEAIMKLHAIKLWAESLDIKKFLGMKSEEDAFVQVALESASFLEEPYIDPLDDEITFESPLTDAEYAQFNAVTMEAYVGKTKIVLDSIQFVKDIRTQFPDKSGKLSAEAKAAIKKILRSWETELSNEFNVEETTLGLENMYNAYAYPMTLGNSVQFKAAQEVKILETATGYRFDKKDNLYLLMCLGIRLLCDPKLSDEGIVAVLFHELGHGFQQYKNDSIEKQRRDGITFGTIGDIKQLLYMVGTFQIINATKFAFQLIGGLFSKGGYDKDRKSYGGEINRSTNKDMDDVVFKDGKAEPFAGESSGFINPIAAIIYCFQFLLASLVSALPLPGISSFIVTIIYDPLYLIDLAIRGQYYKRKKADEHFADTFAAMYGLGISTAELHYRFYEQSLDKICEIPLIQIAVQFNMLLHLSMVLALDDHPTNRIRIKAVYENLEKEINENTNLSPKLRAEAMKELDAIRAIYNDLISPSVNIKNGRIGQALMWFCISTFIQLKKTAKNVAEFTGPIIANNIQIIKAGVEGFSRKKQLGEELGTDEKAAALIANNMIKK